MEAKKGIAILGFTGSIGTQALEVIEAYPDIFDLQVITAHSNADLLIAQAIKHKPNTVVIGDESLYEKVKQAVLSKELINRISRAQGSEGMMPQGRMKLPQNKIDIIVKWKDQGFQN